MRTIFDEAKVALPAGTPPTLASLREAAPTLVPDEVVRAYRASVSRLAFEDAAFEAACWGCGAALRRSLVGLSCRECGVVVPVDARPALPRYVFAARVASGGQGTVWKALYEPLADWRAVKAIPLLEPEREAQIRDEARHANALRHPEIPRVHDVVRDEDTVYIAMEWIEGETLATTHPRPRQAVDWILLAARAVGVAHERGLVHRDVKPGNLMRASDGAIKVVDFGLALPASEGARGVVGTPAYMAPEVARGEPATTRSDVWSLGATLHSLLVGRPPIERETDEPVEDYLVRRGSAVAPALGAPPELAAIVARALALDPRERYADAASLAQDLERLLDGRPVLAFGETLGGPRRAFYSLGRHVDRNPVATIASCLLGIAAVALAFLLFDWLSRGMTTQQEHATLGSWMALVEARRDTRRHDRAPAALEAALREAAAELEAVGKRHPSSPPALLARARARRLVGELEGAAADLRRAREVGSRDGRALLALVLLEQRATHEIELTPSLEAEIALGRKADRALLGADEQVVLDAFARTWLDRDEAGARAQLEAAQAKTPSEELCLALARLAATRDERDRWLATGRVSAPGDPRLHPKAGE